VSVNSKLKVAGITVLAAAAAGAIAALIVRDQISRHQRNLFSSSALRRLAALGHMAKAAASVDNIRLLRDFIAWEPRRLLRERAAAIVRRMELEAASNALAPDQGAA
jgi:hypothetical protein